MFGHSDGITRKYDLGNRRKNPGKIVSSPKMFRFGTAMKLAMKICTILGYLFILLNDLI